MANSEAMDAWIRNGAHPERTRDTSRGNTTPAEEEPAPGQGSGEGGARGRHRAPGWGMDDWLRRAAGRRFSWEERLDASDFGLEQGRPEVNR